MSCERARHLFDAYWDDELTQAEREWLEAHFASCTPCHGAYEALARTLELVGGLPRFEVTSGFAERTLARARRAGAEPDRVSARAPRWIPVTAAAAAALLAVLGATVLQWGGMPRPGGRSPGSVVSETIRQPVLVGPAPVARSADAARGTSSTAGMGDGAVAVVPDSIFDHSEDVEFILDPFTLRKGRAHTRISSPQDAPRGQQATITF